MITTDSNITQAAAAAAAWLAGRCIFLDTETTGLSGTDEICDLAVIDTHGQVLLNTFVKPTIPIPSAAYLIHGITDDEGGLAPRFVAVREQLAALTYNRPVIIFNADYDSRLLRQSAHAAGVVHTGMWSECAMKLYAQFYGDYDDFRG